MRCNGVLMSRIVALLISVLWLHDGHILVRASEPNLNAPAVRVDITIKGRQFHPSPVSVPVGRSIMLVFYNQDVELHAFVPQQFLEHVPVHIDGNGAPQFGEKGLERVLIPSEGREEIRFVPTEVGTFEYRCDLPGHQMVGTIIVEEAAADPRTALERHTNIQGNP